MNRTRSRDNTTEPVPQAYTKISAETDHEGRNFFGNVWQLPLAGSITVNPSAIILEAGCTGIAESMTDVVGNQGHFNPCMHDKMIYKSPLTTVKMEGVLRDRTGSVVEGVATSVFTVGIPRVRLDNTTLEGRFTTSEEEMLLEAASQCRPGVVKPQFDVSLQLGELLESFKSLQGGMKTIEQIRRDITRLDRWNSPAVRKLLGQRTLDKLSMKDWAKLATSAHLGYNLAIMPLIKACKQLREAGSKYDAFVSNYQTSEEDYHGVSVRESSDYINDLWPTEGYHYYSASVQEKKSVHATVRIRYGANAWLRQGSKSLEAVTAAGTAFDLTYYGLVPSASTTWALMPFSFVIDWFVGFGRYLAQWAAKPIPELEYEVIGTWWSVKTISTLEITADLCAKSALSDYRELEGPTLIRGIRVHETYRREPKAFDPTVFTPSPPKLGLPGAGQAVTLVELILQCAFFKDDLFRVAKPGSSPKMQK